jgi:hypothetical protein
LISIFHLGIFLLFSCSEPSVVFCSNSFIKHVRSIVFCYLFFFQVMYHYILLSLSFHIL